jgi:hypothetical protein
MNVKLGVAAADEAKKVMYKHMTSLDAKLKKQQKKLQDL